ncbi:hypothetical protein MTR_6g078050 [Medicago truncatula]|uniref:Uncharacterized protein n=1 Tax=Medicago truncatula TaxID=3880 RepID=G7KKP0_MEDTR|nr:hypothetical protein MTR_6g078050 [Medicago truncatula]
MRRTCSAANLTRYVDKIGRSFRARHRLQFDTQSGFETQTEIGDNNNNDNQPLKDFDMPSDEDHHTNIVRPKIAVNNFKLKPSLLQIVQQNQFFGNPTENPNLHLSVFV